MSIQITIDRIKNGMILSERIVNKFGQMLLPAETKLEEKHKKLLKTWGVQSIHIKDDVIDSPEWELEKKRSLKAKEILAKRMNWEPRNIIEESIQETALVKIMEKINF